MTDAVLRPETVLVVIPVRNRPRLVLKTLDTLLAQTHAPDELVVVDDGSTDADETAQSIEAWIRDRSPPFPARVLRQEHGGLSAARNTGFAAGRPVTTRPPIKKGGQPRRTTRPARTLLPGYAFSGRGRPGEPGDP